MNFKSLTLIITEKCNYNCSYCFQLKREKNIDHNILLDSLDFFYPYMKENYYINFFGGEPLLNFTEIKNVVNVLKKRKKKVNFSLTTNASRLDNNILKFLDNNNFFIQLSFDGYAHNLQRKSNDFEIIIRKIKKILKYKNIELNTNSVFIPENIHYLAKSVELLINLGIKNIDYTLSIIDDYKKNEIIKYKNELYKVEELIINNFKKNGVIPIPMYNKKKFQKGIFKCSAGRDFITIDTDGNLWGCYMFFDYYKKNFFKKKLKKFSFGNIYDFTNEHKKVYKKVLGKYLVLRNDYFSSTERKKCYLCENLGNCRICPLNSAFNTEKIGLVPSWKCKIDLINNNSVKSVRQRLKD